MNEDRTVVLEALVGSHNYNLNDELSDKDYKYFVLPTFDDLYSGKMFSTSHVGDEIDYTVHDVRKLEELFFKANLNFLEVLYSDDVSCAVLIQNFITIRDDIATMNLPYLFNACKGMYFEKRKLLTKGTEGTKNLVDKYGYDTKQAMHACRILDFCMRFADGDFKHFKNSMTYKSRDRKFMLEIKNGLYSLSRINLILDEYYNHFMDYEKLYKEQPVDTNLKLFIHETIKTIVKRGLNL